MRSRLLIVLLLVAAGALPARADVPRVAADIAPVQSLVARVMRGLGTPDLIIPPGDSPHRHVLRPSEARALDAADLVVWVGAPLSAAMANALDTLASDAARLTLLEAPGTLTLPFREETVFAAEDDHDHEQDDGHGHDGDHGEDHVGDHEQDHGHDHASGVDPHAWLDPVNAAHWLDLVADALATADPENAARYRANAADGRAEIEALTRRIAARLAPLSDRPFIVFHDAYHYFEDRFGLHAAGAIALGDASDPSPARIDRLRRAIADAGIVCVFAEPQFNPGLVETVLDGSGADMAVIDPLGGHLAPGEGFYVALIEAVAEAFAGCLDPA